MLILISYIAWRMDKEIFIMHMHIMETSPIKSVHNFFFQNSLLFSKNSEYLSQTVFHLHVESMLTLYSMITPFDAFKISCI